VMCGLTEAEVAAIAEHEHVPEIAAATLGRYLLDHAHGVEKIRQMLVDDIRAAFQAGSPAHAAALISALRHFLSIHPSWLRARGSQAEIFTEGNFRAEILSRWYGGLVLGRGGDGDRAAAQEDVPQG